MEIVIEHLKTIVDNRQRQLEILENKVPEHLYTKLQIELDTFKKAIFILTKGTE